MKKFTIASNNTVYINLMNKVEETGDKFTIKSEILMMVV